MKINYWNPLIVVIGIVAVVGVVCILIFNIRKLELAHQENMTDKALSMQIFNQPGTPMVKSGKPWKSFKALVQKMITEICPAFIMRFIGL